MKKQFLSKSVPRGTRTIWRYLGALFILFTFAIGNVWGTDVYYIVCNKAKLPLTAGMSGSSAQLLKLDGSTLSTTTDISIATSGSVGEKLYYNSTTATYAALTTTSNYSSGQSSSRTMSGFDLGGSNSQLTIKCGSKSYSKLDVIYSCNSNDEKSISIAGTSYKTKDKNIHLASISNVTGDIVINNNSGKNYYVFAVLTYAGSTPEPGGDPIDPVFTYTAATYTIGDPALDLSTKVTSTNTTGAITFAVSTADAGTTGASIANSKNFTATTVGTAKVTVTQAASTGYKAKSQDIDVSVAAPDPCHRYFWFSKAADATTAGVTNNEGGFFTTSASGSNGTTSSITIDEVEYAITNRTSNIGADDATIVSFTIPANKAGVLYVNMASSGNKGESSSRTLYLKKGGVTIVTATNAIYGDGAQHNATIENIPSGTYTLHANNNVKVGMFAVKACDATYHTITLDLDGGTGTTSIAALDGAPATKPADPTKENADFVKWVVKSTGNDYDWTSNVTGDLTLKAVWSQWPKLKLEAGEGAIGEAVETYHKAGSSVAVPAKPTGFSNGTKEFTGWVYSSDVEITDGAFPMPSSDLTLTAQWASATAVAQIVGGASYETFAAAIAAVTDGQTIQLLQDIDVDAQIEIAGVDITIDLNGHKIEYVGDATLPSGVILVHNGASLTINDSSDPSAGSIVSGDKAYAAVALTKLGDDASTPATLVVNGGALTGYYYGITGNGSRNNTVITINGGTITGTVGTAIYNPQVGTLTVNNGTLTGLDAAIEMRAGTLVINDGTFTATATEFSCNPNGSGSTTSGAAIAIAQHTTKKEISVTINGGTFNGVKAINESNPQVNDPAPQVTMAVTAGTFTGEVTTADVNNFISGGTFDHEVTANQCAEGYAPKDNGNGTYGVKPLAQTFSLEDLVTAQGTGANYTTYLNNLGWTVANADALDNLNTDKDYDNYPYLGLKFKNAEGYVAGEVEGGKLLTIKLGHMAGVAHLMVDDVKKMELDGVDAETPKVHYYYVENTANVKLLMANAGSKQTCVLKAITVADPFTVTFDANGGDDVASQNGTPSVTLPSATKGTEVFKGWYDAAEAGNLIGKAGDSYTPTANVTLHAQWEIVSSDATLSALEVNGATVAGFDPETYIYNIVCEYGQQPTITKATATAGTLATVTINNTPVDEGTYKYVQVKVVPQSGEEGKKFYQVRYTNLPKKGVSLIKATHTGAKTADVTGYLGGTYDKNTASDGKLGDANTYFGIKLTEGNFQAGDVLYIHASTVSSAVRIYSDKGTTRINAEDGTFDANKMFTYTLTAETEWIYIYRKVKDGESDMNPYVDYIEVQRYMDPFIESFEIEGIGALDINPTTKAITASVPESFDVTALTPTIKAWANGSAHLDKSGAQNFTNSVTYKVTSDYDEDGEVTYTVTITKVAPSATPTITTQPVSANYVEGASINALTVVAESTAGELSYQWQVKNGLEFEDIDGATAASYTPTVSAIGSYIYRVVVTNTEESKPATSVNSNEATIVIAADPSCATFVGEIADPTYEYTNSGVWTIYNASSSGKYNESHVFDTGKNFENENVNVYKKERCVMIFEKDMKQVRFYSTGNTRDWATANAVQVSEDKANFLAKQSLTYSTMAATTSMDNSYAADGKSCILIANGDFEAGKVYWFAFNGTLQVSRICAVEADPKAEAPVFNGALSDEAICEGGTFAALNATASPVTSYAWYKDDEVIAGATAATYTPTEAGTYYCIATNSAAGYRSASTKSAEAVLSVNEAASVTMANISGKAAASIALNAVATGANPHYAWFTCDDAEGNNAVAIPGAADAASYAIPTPVATQYYKVVVTTDCGNASAVALVTLLPDIVPLADVTESTIWDWAEITARADGSAIDEVIDNKNHGPRVATANGLVLANYVLGGGYWDKIEGNNNAYAIRNTSNVYYQGASLHMHTTKGGILKINARNDGSAMKMKIGSAEFALTSTFTDYVVYVPAGDVTIENVPETAGKPMRVRKITFTVKESPDYTRDEMLGAGVYGTICLPNNVPAGAAFGATFYEIAGREPQYGKIAFDEVTELKAGIPYVFQAHGDVINIFYGENHVDNPATEDTHGMYGTFTATTLTELEGVYYFANRALWSCVDLTELILPANRAYVKLSEVGYLEPNNAPAPGRRRVTMGVNGPDQVPTAIDNAEASEAPRKVMINGELFIIRGEKMYDGTGRLVK